MICSSSSLISSIAFLANLRGVVAKPSPIVAAEVTTGPKYSVLEVVPVGNLNITLYGIPDEEPNAAPALHERCGGGYVQCEDSWKTYARSDLCTRLIASIEDPNYINRPLPNGMKSACAKAGPGADASCCIAYTHNLSGANAHWSDLLPSAEAVYNTCGKFKSLGYEWLSGRITDRIVAGRCGTQCLSAKEFCE